MISHIVRWTAVTLNLFLGGLLTTLWVTGGEGGMTSDWMGWIALFSLVTATVASTGAGVFLVRRRTMVLGLQWHGIVTWCLLTFFVACVLESLRHTLDSGLLGLLAVISVWPMLSILLKLRPRGEGGVPVQQLPMQRTMDRANVVKQLPAIVLPNHSIHPEKASVQQIRQRRP